MVYYKCQHNKPIHLISYFAYVQYLPQVTKNTLSHLSFFIQWITCRNVYLYSLYCFMEFTGMPAKSFKIVGKMFWAFGITSNSPPCLVAYLKTIIKDCTDCLALQNDYLTIKLYVLFGAIVIYVTKIDLYMDMVGRYMNEFHLKRITPWILDPLILILYMPWPSWRCKNNSFITAIQDSGRK